MATEWNIVVSRIRLCFKKTRRYLRSQEDLNDRKICAYMRGPLVGNEECNPFVRAVGDKKSNNNIIIYNFFYINNYYIIIILLSTMMMMIYFFIFLLLFYYSSKYIKSLIK